MSSQQQFLQQWQGYLQQIGGQVQQIMGEADAGCRQLLAAHPTDPIPMQNALQAIHLKIVGLRQQYEQTWSQQIQTQLMGFGDNRAVMEQGTQQKEHLEQWIDETWERFRASWKLEAYKAMWPTVQQEMAKPVMCTQCGGPITPTLRHKADSVRCTACNAVNNTTPAQTVGMFYSMAPDAWAEFAVLDKRFEISRFRKQAEVGARQSVLSFGTRNDEPIESLQKWEAMERDYWKAYFAAKAQIMPQPPDDQAKMVESRMQRLYDDLKHYAAWQAARGQGKVEVAVIPRELADVDEWGPLRWEQVEDFEFHQFMLEESRTEPQQFHALLGRFGYADNLQYERVRATFRKYMNPMDPRIQQAQVNARNRATQEQMALKAQQSGDLLSPIEGVSLEQYAALVAHQAGGMEQAQFNQLLAQNNMNPAKWDRVSTGWTDRMSRDTSGVVGNAYAKAFSGAGVGQYGAQAQAGSALMGGAAPPPGVDPASVSFEKFCEIMGAQNAWSMQGKDVNAMLKKVFNMSALDWSNVSSYWSTKMMSDMNLAMNMANLMTAAQNRYMAM